jgi:hypothetical protein
MKWFVAMGNGIRVQYSMLDNRQYGTNITLNRSRTESQNAKPLRCKPIISLDIPSMNIRMIVNAPINFHDELGLQAGKINNQRPNIGLSAKLGVTNFGPAQMLPK